MGIVTELHKKSQLILVHDADKYEHPSGNVYAFTKGGKGNKYIRTALTNIFGNRNLAELMFCLETRFSYWWENEEFYTYIRPNEKQFKKINKDKKEGMNGFQKSVMEEVGIKADKTFQRLYTQIGCRFDSKQMFTDAVHKFGTPTLEHPQGQFFYTCYQNRMYHTTCFRRNNEVVNRFINKIRKEAKLPYDKNWL